MQRLSFSMSHLLFQSVHEGCHCLSGEISGDVTVYLSSIVAGKASEKNIMSGDDVTVDYDGQIRCHSFED